MYTSLPSDGHPSVVTGEFVLRAVEDDEVTVDFYLADARNGGQDEVFCAHLARPGCGVTFLEQLHRLEGRGHDRTQLSLRLYAERLSLHAGEVQHLCPLDATLLPPTPPQDYRLVDLTHLGCYDEVWVPC